MEESYEVSPSQTPWPQEMRDGGQPPARSVLNGAKVTATKFDELGWNG